MRNMAPPRKVSRFPFLLVEKSLMVGGILVIFVEYIPFFIGWGPGADLLFAHSGPSTPDDVFARNLVFNVL